MISPRLIASAIVASGLWLAPSHARADDRSRPDATPPADEPAHVIVRPPGETPPVPATPVTPTGKREPTGTFTLGAGYNSDEGFLATAQVAQPRLFGTGHGLSLSALISALRQDFVLAYNTPTFGDGWICAPSCTRGCASAIRSRDTASAGRSRSASSSTATRGRTCGIAPSRSRSCPRASSTRAPSSAG